MSETGAAFGALQVIKQMAATGIDIGNVGI